MRACRLCLHLVRGRHANRDPRGGDGHDRGGRPAHGAPRACLDYHLRRLLGHDRMGCADALGHGLSVQRAGDRLAVRVRHRHESIALRTPLRVGWLDWAREALTATLAAQILALPLILYSFGNLSIVAPLANVIMLPFVPAAMLFGAIALLGGMVWLPLGQWLAIVAYLFLAWLTEGARLFAKLPYAAVQLPPFPL
jgi:hypothetical protein